MKTTAEFRAFYEQSLQSPLRILDAKRVKVRNRVLLTGALVAACIVAAVALGCVFEARLDQSPIPGVVGLFILFYVVYWTVSSAGRKIGEYAAEFDRTVMRGLIDFIQPGLAYTPGGMLPPQVYGNSGLFPGRSVDRYTGSDLIEGTIGITPIRFSQVKAEEKTHERSEHGTREKWRTIFKGLLFVCEFNKTFQGKTFVFPDTAERLFGWLGAAVQKLHGGHGQLVKLEDPEFEKRFVVYGDNQIEARYVLSPSLMSRLGEFKDKSRRWVAAAFVQSNLYVAIGYPETLFQPSLFRTMLNFEQVKKSFDALSLVLGIVEDLNLNVRIWGARAALGGDGVKQPGSTNKLGTRKE